MKEYLKKHLINILGKRIKHKVLVIESDDWGSIRIPNLDTKTKLQNLNLINSKDAFSNYDTLENEQDYSALFEVLNKHKDVKGSPSVITANMVMGNPDFDKIKESNFDEFYWEPISKTYESYYPNENTLSSLLNGVQNAYLFPQFHAHEHLNVHQWLLRLKSGESNYLKAFDLNCFAINDHSKSNFRTNLMATYDYRSKVELNQINNHIKLGLNQFTDLFGFNSQTSIAPCYVWNDEIEKTMHENQVKGLQSSYVQMLNSPDSGVHYRIWRKMGAKNKYNQIYTIRNVLFEPALSPSFNWVDSALQSIEVAFFWGQPAVLASHRLNYVSSLSEDNRTNSLRQLDRLLAKVKQKWPDIQFMNSAQLVNQYA